MSIFYVKIICRYLSFKKLNMLAYLTKNDLAKN